MKPVLRSIVLLTALVGPCAFGQDAAALYEEALIALEDDRDREATIFLKNALQADPDHVPSRVLLGRVHFQNGDPAAAEKELRYALALGADPNLILVPLGYTLLLLEDYTAIIELELPRITRATTDAWGMIRGRAFLNLDQLEEARSTFEELLDWNPEDIGALLGLANVQYLAGQREDAEQTTRTILGIDDQTSSAWKIRGDIARDREAIDESLSFYENAIAADPTNFAALRAKVLLFLSQGRDADALEAIEQLREQRPDDPQTILLYAWLLSKSKQSEEASELLDTLGSRLGTVDESFVERNADVQLATGLTLYLQERIDEALPYLTRYLERQPNHTGIRVVLARIAKQRGQRARLVSLLKPIEGELFSRPDLLADYVRALSALDRAGEAEALLNSLRRERPEYASTSARLLAAVYIEQGRVDDALAALAAEGEVGNGVQAGLMLGYMLLSQNDTEGARQTADRLVAKYPEQAEVLNFAGSVYLRTRDLEQARELLLDALAIAPDELAIALNLAYLTRADGRIDEAKAAFTTIVSEYPETTQAVIALSEIATAQADVPSAIRWTERLTVMEPGNSTHQYRLAKLHYSAGAFDEANELLSQLEREFPLQEQLVELKARILIAEGRREEASRWLGFLFGANSDNPEKIAEIASLQIDARDAAGAQGSIERLVDLQPDSTTEVALLSARVKMLQGDLESARETLAPLAESDLNTAAVQDLLVVVSANLGAFDDVEKHYRSAQALAPSIIRLRRMVGLFWQREDFERSLALIDEWLTLNPGDVDAEELLAQALIGAKRPSEALVIYREALNRGADLSFSAHNNLAYLLMDDDLTEALVHAQKAYGMQPRNPAVADTFGWILVKAGRAGEGLPLLREAYTRASQAPSVQFHLAYALAELGRTDEATRLLRDLLDEQEVLDDALAKDAKTLLDTLPSRVPG